MGLQQKVASVLSFTILVMEYKSLLIFWMNDNYLPSMVASTRTKFQCS